MVEGESFETAHPEHQSIDNCKHLLLSTATFLVSALETSTFAIEMSATSLYATPHDYRDGFVTFNVIELSTGMVFDFGMRSDRLFALYERLPLPGVETPFTYIVDAPLSGRRLSPGTVVDCVLVFEPATRSVFWHVNGGFIFEARDVLFPREIVLGLGLLTLHPCADGRSQSLKVQGIRGTWQNLRVGEPQAG